MKRRPQQACIAFLFLLAVGISTEPVGGADHLDAPGLTPPGGDPALDITDIYAFRGADCDDCTVFIMGVNGLSEPGVDAPFARFGQYLFRLDTNGDASQDLSFLLRFGKQRQDGSQHFNVTMRRRGVRRPMKIVRGFQGTTTTIGSNPLIIHGAMNIRVFAGMTDDPFFFDLPGFLGIDFCPSNPTPDTFAGTNIGAIALEIPNSVLSMEGPDLGVWGITRRAGRQIERMGRPAINTVFIPNNPFEPNEPSLKNAFNESSPASDQRLFRHEVVDTLEIFYGSGSADAQALADFLLPDILTFSTDEPPGFPNGRTLSDDVIDVELGLVTNGAVTTDCVDSNDLEFRQSFPYLAPAHL